MVERGEEEAAGLRLAAEQKVDEPAPIRQKLWPTVAALFSRNAGLRYYHRLPSARWYPHQASRYRWRVEDGSVDSPGRSSQVGGGTESDGRPAGGIHFLQKALRLESNEAAVG